MASLSGNTISSSYPGLFKTEDNAAITSTKTNLTDGLGNQTGIKIATNYFSAPNVYEVLDLKGQYYGPGFAASGTAPVANTQNILIYSTFYDPGMYDYSAITYNITTATTSSDVVDVAFYTLQMTAAGIQPSDLIMSGITLTTNSTGLKTTSLPSTLSFSGYGGGFFGVVYKISNAGITPTVRWGNSIPNFQITITQLGLSPNNVGLAITQPFRTNATSNTVPFSGLTSFQTSYTASQVVNAISTSAAVLPNALGFALNTRNFLQ